MVFIKVKIKTLARIYQARVFLLILQELKTLHV